MKHSLTKEIISITTVAALLGLLFNAFHATKPLSWIKEQIVVPTANDKDLFSTIEKPSSGSTNQTPPVNSSISQSSGVMPTAKAGAVDKTEQSTSLPKSVDIPPKKNTESTSNSAPEVKKSSDEPSVGKLPPNNDRYPDNPGKAKSVTYDQVLKLIGRNGVAFIDARKAEEFGKGHIGNARNFDMLQLNADPAYRNQIVPQVYAIKDNTIVVYCGGGNCELSHELAEFLMQFGCEKVYIYLGGWTEYSQKQGLK